MERWRGAWCVRREARGETGKRVESGSFVILLEPSKFIIVVVIMMIMKMI